MPIPPHEPKTLSAARETIKSLRAQLAGARPPAGDKPIPKTPEDPHPVPGRTEPIPKSAVLDLSKLPPSTFADVLARCGDKELKILLSRETAKIGKEQDGSVVARLYREIKKRGRSA